MRSVAPPSTALPVVTAPIAAPRATLASGEEGGGIKATVLGVVDQPPLPWELCWIHPLLWNIACTGSLIVTLAWTNRGVGARSDNSQCLSMVRKNGGGSGWAEKEPRLLVVSQKDWG